MRPRRRAGNNSSVREANETNARAPCHRTDNAARDAQSIYANVSYAVIRDCLLVLLLFVFNRGQPSWRRRTPLPWPQLFICLSASLRCCTERQRDKSDEETRSCSPVIPTRRVVAGPPAVALLNSDKTLHRSQPLRGLACWSRSARYDVYVFNVGTNTSYILNDCPNDRPGPSLAKEKGARLQKEKSERSANDGVSVRVVHHLGEKRQNKDRGRDTRHGTGVRLLFTALSRGQGAPGREPLPIPWGWRQKGWFWAIYYP